MRVKKSKIYEELPEARVTKNTFANFLKTKMSDI